MSKVSKDEKRMRLRDVERSGAVVTGSDKLAETWALADYWARRCDELMRLIDEQPGTEAAKHAQFVLGMIQRSPIERFLKSAASSVKIAESLRLESGPSEIAIVEFDEPSLTVVGG